MVSVTKLLLPEPAFTVIPTSALKASQVLYLVMRPEI